MADLRRLVYLCKVCFLIFTSSAPQPPPPAPSLPRLQITASTSERSIRPRVVAAVCWSLVARDVEKAQTAEWESEFGGSLALIPFSILSSLLIKLSPDPLSSDTGMQTSTVPHGSPF